MGREEKNKVAARKKKIGQEFREKMGLLIERPKPGGSGNCNDGNTARRFFRDPELTASITGINKELLLRFSTILRAISTSYPINIENFNKYALDTTKLYTHLYSWYYMPVSVHKILIHGGQVIESTILPIGMLSEEAQEARHKHVKRFRESHVRKFSRKENMQDILNMLLVSSDPVISHIAAATSNLNNDSLPKEVRNLLKEPSESVGRSQQQQKVFQEKEEEEEEEVPTEEEKGDDDNEEEAEEEGHDDDVEEEEYEGIIALQS